MNAAVSRVRRLRAGHWLLTDSTMGYAPCGANRVVLLDGLGTPVR